MTATMAEKPMTVREWTEAYKDTLIVAVRLRAALSTMYLDMFVSEFRQFHLTHPGVGSADSTAACCRAAYYSRQLDEYLHQQPVYDPDSKFSKGMQVGAWLLEWVADVVCDEGSCATCDAARVANEALLVLETLGTSWQNMSLANFLISAREHGPVLETGTSLPECCKAAKVGQQLASLFSRVPWTLPDYETSLVESGDLPLKWAVEEPITRILGLAKETTEGVPATEVTPVLTEAEVIATTTVRETVAELVGMLRGMMVRVRSLPQVDDDWAVSEQQRAKVQKHLSEAAWALKVYEAYL